MDLFPNGYRPDRPISAEEPSPVEPDRQPRRRRRSTLWRGAKATVGAPFAAFPLGHIVRSGRLIGGLVSDLQAGPASSRGGLQQRDGKLDLAATAMVEGVSETELQRLLLVRRRQTARLAYAAFGLGWLFVGAWLYRTLGLEWTGQRVLAAAQFTPFCLIFFLTAFKQAHVNWQLRTGVLGSAGDYLRSPESFWPSA